MIFRICLYLFLFFHFTGSRMYLGDLITVRLFLTFFLFLLNILEERRFATDRIIILYVIFVSVFGLSSVITGNSDLFYTSVLTYYFATFVGWRAIVIYLKKCRKENRNGTLNIVLFIILIGLFDTIVTYSQFINRQEWYRPVQDFFQFPTAVFFEEALEYQTEQSYMTTFLPGIFGNVIVNGYFLALCSVFSMSFIVKYKNPLFFIFPFLFLIGSFICQERAPFFLAIIGIIFITRQYFFFSSRYNKVLIMFFVALALYGALFFYSFSEANEMRFSSLGFDDGGRNEVYKKYLEYISKEPLLPNFYEAVKVVGVAPHNLFLNAFIYGGFISFTSIMIILFIQAKRTFKVVIQRMTKDNYLVIIVGVSWFVFSLNGLVHNRSIVTGELMPWVLWAIIQNSYSFTLKYKN